MRGLRDALEQSEKDGVAIGHFNVADWVLLKAVLASGQELRRVRPCGRTLPTAVGASSRVLRNRERQAFRPPAACGCHRGCQEGQGHTDHREARSVGP
jgi:hypothetical protein